VLSEGHGPDGEGIAVALERDGEGDAGEADRVGERDGAGDAGAEDGPGGETDGDGGLGSGLPPQAASPPHTVAASSAAKHVTKARLIIVHLPTDAAVSRTPSTRMCHPQAARTASRRMASRTRLS